MISNPAGLWLLVSIPVIVALHLLRFRPRRYVAPSLRLWGVRSSEPVANSLWQRLKRRADLMLQLCAAVLLSFALAGLGIPGVLRPVVKRVYVLDVSPSMLALTNGGRARLEAARDLILDELDDAGPEDVFGLVLAGESVRVALPFGAGAHDMRPALDIRADDAAMPFDTLLRDISTISRGMGRDAQLVFVTGPSEKEIVNSLPPSVGVVTVGEPVQNNGIVAITVDQRSGSVHIDTALTGQGNLLLEERQNLERWKLLDARSADDSAVRFALEEPLAPRRLRVRIEQNDRFALDDSAELLLTPRARFVPVLHGTNEALSKLLKALGADDGAQPSRGSIWLAPELPGGVEALGQVNGYVCYQPDEWWTGLNLESFPALRATSFTTDSAWRPLLTIDGMVVAARRELADGGADLVIGIALDESVDFLQSNTFVTMIGRWFADNERALTPTPSGPVADESGRDPLLDTAESRRVAKGEPMRLDAQTRSEDQRSTLELWPWLLVTAILCIVCDVALFGSRRFGISKDAAPVRNSES
ncbi:MAG: BatA and WFA domain-containing protein [Planctomycetes bacterium]|nr:BatA and WFA domain-containing protein [Planctomycetota bacterium]NUQ34515.1 BatA domain-containing protein [Planctomycetaceae bacterium]